MLIDTEELEKYFLKNLSINIFLSFKNYENCKRLEFKMSRDYVNESYRKDWVASREALYNLKERLSDKQRISDISFPSERYSLSHSNGNGLALGTSEKVRGVGVDFEYCRRMKAETARFFLSSDEIEMAKSLTSGKIEENLVRLWTIKEAIFKSDRLNVDRGIKDYDIVNLSFNSGNARVDNGKKKQKFKFSNYYDGKMSLSVAVEI